MKKSIGKKLQKFLSVAIILFFIIGILPQTALAAFTYPIANGTTVDLTNGTICIIGATIPVALPLSEGDTLNISAGASVTITGTTDVPIQITCEEGVTLTLSDVTVNVSGTEDACALSFTGSGNTLILSGENTLSSGTNEPGVRVEADTELVINGQDDDDSLTVTGGQYGAGIGGGREGNGGTITIESGTVTATGGSGGHGGAGIGGGYSGAGGTITISGGTVTARGGSGLYSGTGIGGGTLGGGGTITISGGMVYAERGQDAYYDIGAGLGCDGGTFTLSGGALVFLRNDKSKTPVTESHTHFSRSGPLYGFSLPSGWSDAGIYAVPCILMYDDNGGTGGGEKVTVPKDGTVATLSGSGLSNPGYSLKEWNTTSDGTETSYETGDSITMTKDITLYAIWEAADSSMISSVTPSGDGAALDGNIVITFANDMDETVDGTVTVGGETLADGTWSSSNRVYTISYSVELFNTEYSIDISGFKDTYGTEMNSTSYSFTTEAPAELKSLSVGTGTLTFDADTAAYSVDATGINSIGITAETKDSAATLTINGVSAISGTETTVNLNNGANMIPVVVTAQDGVQKSYIISVNGTVSNADLSSLTLSEGTLSFDKNTTDYYVTVGSDVTSIDLTASADDSKAVMLLDGAIFTSGVSKSVDLSVGENIFTLMVIAQDATTKTYTVTINRGSSDVTLSGISLSDGTVSPSFNRTTYAYTASVANAVDSLTVSPTAFDNAATVTVNGADAATPVNLTVGSNTITIEVTGSDGVTTKEYTITVTRQAEITITNTSLPVSIVDGFYSVTMAAEGGDGSFTWSATGLPSILSLDSATGILSGTPADGDVGAYTVTITATDGNGVKGDKTYTLVVQKGCGGGAFLIVSDGDPAYTGSYTDDGIPTLTVNDGVSGFTYFGVDISAVTGHAGKEICVFVQSRNGVQIAFSFNRADYDTVDYSGVGFNVQAGDVIEVFIVDTLSNGSGSAPTVL